jgi:hypothetical protein
VIPTKPFSLLPTHFPYSSLSLSLSLSLCLFCLIWLCVGKPLLGLSEIATVDHHSEPSYRDWRRRSFDSLLFVSKNYSMAVVFDSGFVVFCFIWILRLSGRVNSEPAEDKQALLAFLNQTPHANRVQWNSAQSACDWFGVECDANRSFVYSLRLPGVGLVGPIPPNTLGRLSGLRVLSLRANRLSGEIPSDFSNLTLLRSLYLQNNELSGEFPPSLTQLSRLARLDLSSNKFTGPIPFSINNLTHLTGLLLENNNFSGPLPSIAAGLVNLNVSNNNLNGSIPKSLENFPASAFAGNEHLCGKPLLSCTPFFPSPAPSPSENPSPNPVRKKSKKLSTAVIVAIVVGSALLALLLLVLLLLCLRKRHRRQPNKVPKPPVATARSFSAEAGTSSSKDDITGGSIEAERNKLVFFEGGVYSFDLEDLLRASAEVLGKGSVGTSYKAVLEEGTTVVVKRLKDVTVTKRDFEMQMEVLGKIKHDNVVPLRAFYYSKDEKLLVSDFMAAGSLSALLHGNDFHFSFASFYLKILQIEVFTIIPRINELLVEEDD